MIALLKSHWLRLALFFLVDAVLIGCGILFWLVVTLPRIPDDLEALSTQTGVSIYADSGELLYTFNRRINQVTLDEVSPYFIQAVIATEDLEFYTHHGFNIKSIAGAFYENIRSFRKTRGGSTLTQQIVKNLFLTREKSYLRKLKEVLLSAQLETMYSRKYGSDYKQKLLELYINGSFYGTNAYGIEDAAQTYFEKTAAELTLAESALLAGLPNAPSALSPFREDREKAVARTAHVLRRMVTAEWISQEAMDQAIREPLELTSTRKIQNPTPYFVEAIKSEVADMWGHSALSFGGLSIYTTLNLELQEAAEEAIEEGLADVDTRLGFRDYREATETEREEYVQGALMSMDPGSGEIKAMVGGRDIFVSYFNRATMAKRQPGSGFKPIVYLAAFASGELSPVSLFQDAPRTYTVNGKPWSPTNFQNSYLGITTAAWAFIKSANSTAVQIAQRVGPEEIAELGKLLGIKSKLYPYPSIALGTSEVTLLDMVSAYGTIANYGIRNEPTFTRSIKDQEGGILYQHQPGQTPVIEASDAYVIIRLMQNVIDRGTGRRVRSAGFLAPGAGKTGTTNDNTDAWFTGFTPDLVTSVWVGFDRKDGNRKLVEAKSRRQITGGSGAAPIWAAYMGKRKKGNQAEFWTPPNVQKVLIDGRTGVHHDLAEYPHTLVEPPIEIALPLEVMLNSPETVSNFIPPP